VSSSIPCLEASSEWAPPKHERDTDLGDRATFLTDYVHTVVILVIIFIFSFTTYATSDILGSPSAVYDALVAASARHPVDGNSGGSYLTMQSREGAIFFVINIVGNFGTVFWYALPSPTKPGMLGTHTSEQ